MVRYRRRESGVAMILVLLVMAGLIAITTMTLVSTLTTVTSAGDERARRVALYSAESGIAAGTEFVFANCTPGTNLGAFVSPSNSTPQAPTGLVGNSVLPGVGGNQFTATLGAWYKVTILNNQTDPGFTAGTDQDAIVYLRSEGHGPDNSEVVIEVEIQDGSCGVAGGGGNYGQETGNGSNTGSTTSGTVNNVGMTSLNANSL